jgi:F0F1-type ATP synthase membrane subunit a
MEIFFGMIQAFIFSILTLIFGILAVTHHGGDEEHAS